MSRCTDCASSSRRILVGEQNQVGAQPRAEAGELSSEIEPPARIARAEQDHQHGRRPQPTGDSASSGAYLLASLAYDGLVASRAEQGINDGDRDNPDQPEEGGKPTQALR